MSPSVVYSGFIWAFAAAFYVWKHTFGAEERNCKNLTYDSWPLLQDILEDDY